VERPNPATDANIPVRKPNNGEHDPRKWLTKKIILNAALPVLQHPLAADLGTGVGPLFVKKPTTFVALFSRNVYTSMS
jgi:hypothetical protein